MANQEFLNAVARIEAAIASILEFAATTGNTAFIERITRLAIKKEIILEMLLDGGNEEVGNCGCNATIDALIPNTDISISPPGVQDVGDVTIIGQICQNCFIEGSTLTFTFSDDTPTPNNSFTLVSTNIEAPRCQFSPNNGVGLSANGLGIVTRADMSIINVSFFFSIFERFTPGASDNFTIQIISTENGNPFSVFYSSSDIPDSSITVKNCAT